MQVSFPDPIISLSSFFSPEVIYVITIFTVSRSFPPHSLGFPSPLSLRLTLWISFLLATFSFSLIASLVPLSGPRLKGLILDMRTLWFLLVSFLFLGFYFFLLSLAPFSFFPSICLRYSAQTFPSPPPDLVTGLFFLFIPYARCGWRLSVRAPLNAYTRFETPFSVQLIIPFPPYSVILSFL